MGLRDLINKVPTPLKQAVKDKVYPDMIAEGELAPEWHLQDQDDNWHRMKGKKWAIMVFYPGDDTPGCTLQLQDFQRHYDRLKELNVEVYGVNPAEADSHKAFADKCGFDFPILVDRGGSVCRQFRCSLPMPYGIKVIRSVYLVNPERKIRMANRGTPPVQAIIRSIEALQQVTRSGM
ncbi:MAG: peroxiredoxin [Myxococcota bacterium]